MEDSDQNIHLKNLSVHAAANEEEALNLLFLGDTNRMIAEVSTTSIEYALHPLISKISNSDLELTLFGFWLKNRGKLICSFSIFIFTDSHEPSLNQIPLHIYNPRYLTRKWISHNTEIQTPLGGFSRVFKLVIIHSKA